MRIIFIRFIDEMRDLLVRRKQHVEQGLRFQIFCSRESQQPPLVW